MVKRLEISKQKETMPLNGLKESIKRESRKKISFKQALADSKTGIIAEFKRRSPSKGWINRKADAGKIASDYEAAGAAAVSCLTDGSFFGGYFEDFSRVRANIKNIPLLRKDFIIDEYQIYHSKAIGADVILLIAACISPAETANFIEIAHGLDMEVLLEIHREEELSHIHPDTDTVGINNRSLNTFKTDINHAEKLSSSIPGNYLKISESGLSNPETVIKLRKTGFQGFLIGENFMKTASPGDTLREFIKKII
jgi:indole-3-glycerol phosphate synthase